MQGFFALFFFFFFKVFGPQKNLLQGGRDVLGRGLHWGEIPPPIPELGQRGQSQFCKDPVWIFCYGEA